MLFSVDGKGAKVHGRIFNGKEVIAHSLPYQVGLACDPTIKFVFCGGALITPRFVLTGEWALVGKLTLVTGQQVFKAGKFDFYFGNLN